VTLGSINLFCRHCCSTDTARCQWSSAFESLHLLLQVKMAQARTEQQREVAADAAAQLAERDAQCAALQAQLDGRAHAAGPSNSGGSPGEGLRAHTAGGGLLQPTVMMHSKQEAAHDA
jgi:hypothetical protein